MRRSLPRHQECKLLETLAEQVRGSDKKCPAIACKARFQISGERIVSVIVKVVVIADVKRRTGIRIPTQQHLAAGVRL